MYWFNGKKAFDLRRKKIFFPELSTCTFRYRRPVAIAGGRVNFRNGNRTATPATKRNGGRTGRSSHAFPQRRLEIMRFGIGGEIASASDLQPH